MVTYVFTHVTLLLHSITTLLPECSVHDCEDSALPQRLEYPQIPEDDEILYFGAFIKLPSGQHHVHNTWPLEVPPLYLSLVFNFYHLPSHFILKLSLVFRVVSSIYTSLFKLCRRINFF